MYDADNKQVLEKTTTYIYDANGNELRSAVSYISPYKIKSRQATKGSVYGDGVDSSIDSLIERTSSTYDGFNRLKKTHIT